MDKITLELLKDRFSICQVKDYTGGDLSRPFIFTGATDSERSLLCPEQYVPDNITKRDDGWRGFRIVGQLDFSLIGILSALSGILASHGIGIFAVSTYNTDYILVKEEYFARAFSVLTAEGYTVV